MKKIVLTLLACSAMSFLVADGAVLYKKCADCHGAKGEKKALGKSKVITGWAAADTEKALKGYKDGSYGGAMKGLMKGQLGPYDDVKISEVAKYIEGLK